MGYTCRHLYQSVEEHKSSAVGVHLKLLKMTLESVETSSKSFIIIINFIVKNNELLILNGRLFHSFGAAT